MLTPDEYLLVWAVYGGAALLAIVGFWGLVNWVPGRPVRNLLRGLFVVLLLTPVDIPPIDNEWAPATMTAFFGIVTHERVMPLVGPPYFFGVAAVLILVAVDFLLSSLRNKKAK